MFWYLFSRNILFFYKVQGSTEVSIIHVQSTTVGIIAGSTDEPI